MNINFLEISSLVFITFFILSSCSNKKKNEVNKPLLVVTTTSMIGDAAKNIVGDSARVKSLMGPGC